MEVKLYIDEKYKKKLDLMVKRMKGSDDNIVVFDGDEGVGKTEMAMGTCYYISQQTGRKYDIDNIFFDLDKVIKFAASTKEQIIHFDEAVLGLLVTKWQDRLQQKFNTLVMIARKKKHFIALCIPKFHRLSQMLIEERAIALVHCYARNNLEKGRFTYYNKKKKNLLYNDWRRTKVKKYKEYYTIRGTFPIASTKIFTKEQNKEYEDKKDEAILAMSQDRKPEDNKSNTQLKHMRQRDKMIGFLKDKLGYSFAKMYRELKDYGLVDLSVESMRRGYSSSHEPSSL